MTIEQIQHLLNYLGYDTGGCEGICGPKTKDALGRFQKAFGLTVTGEVNADTEKALKHAVAYGMPEREEEPEQEDTFWTDIRYFKRTDPGIRCPCGRCGGFPAEPSEKLMRMADKIRRHFTDAKGRETPMNPSSTVRCQSHNDSLQGSAKNSLHIQGRAMDFAVSGVPVAEVIAYTRQLQAAGELHYTYEMVGTGYVHIDV